MIASLPPGGLAAQSPPTSASVGSVTRPIDRLRLLASARGWRIGLRVSDMFPGWVMRVVGADGLELGCCAFLGRDRDSAVDLAAGELLDGLREGLGAGR